MISLVVEDDGDDEFGWFAFVLEIDIDLSDVGAGFPAKESNRKRAKESNII